MFLLPLLPVSLCWKIISGSLLEGSNTGRMTVYISFNRGMSTCHELSPDFVIDVSDTIIEPSDNTIHFVLSISEQILSKVITSLLLQANLVHKETTYNVNERY